MYFCQLSEEVQKTNSQLHNGDFQTTGTLDLAEYTGSFLGMRKVWPIPTDTVKNWCLSALHVMPRNLIVIHIKTLIHYKAKLYFKLKKKKKKRCKSNSGPLFSVAKLGKIKMH